MPPLHFKLQILPTDVETKDDPMNRESDLETLVQFLLKSATCDLDYASSGALFHR